MSIWSLPSTVWKSGARQMKDQGLDLHQVKAIMGDGIICGIAGVDADGNAISSVH